MSFTVISLSIHPNCISKETALPVSNSTFYENLFIDSLSIIKLSDTTKKDVETREVIVGIVTDIDLVHHVSKKENADNWGSSNGNSESDKQ